MPTPTVKKFATDAGVSVDQVENYWNEAQQAANDKFGSKSPQFWTYVIVILMYVTITFIHSYYLLLL